ncbi:MAG: polysaccharide pyruvyl transferase CsaB [Anaerovoracaceae bacterium]|jgi:polysaccharide pyruvyl transferase CsaB
MRIMLFAAGGDIGGGKTHILSLARELSENNDLRLVSFRSGVLADEGREMGLDVVVIENGWNVFNDMRMALREVDSFKPDVIHCHGAKANMLGVLVKKLRTIPVMTTVHSDPRLDYLGMPLKQYTFGLINAIALRNMDFYMAVAGRMEQNLIERGFDPWRIFTIYNGLDFSGANETPKPSKGEDEDIIVGIAARLTPIKDIGTVIRAFNIAYGKNPRLKLLIAGTGEDEDELRALTKELKISHRVEFVGWINDIKGFFSKVDINVLASLSETFPYSLLEGAYEHCPAVASRVGGIPALINHGENGFLFEAGDVETFSDYIYRLSVDEELRRRLAENLFQKAKKDFSLERMRQDQEQVYRTILRRKQYKGRHGAVICGAYGRGNAGDEAILKAILSQFREIDPDMPFWVMSRKKNETRVANKTRAMYIFNVPAFIRSLRKAEIFVNGGGSLIQDVTSSRSLYFYLFTLQAAKWCGCKIIMYGCGIGPINSQKNRRIAAKVLNNTADIITLRDSVSLELLKEMKVEKPEIILAADPTVNISKVGPAAVEAAFAKEGIPSGIRKIGFCLRNWPDFHHPEWVGEAADYAWKTYGVTPIFLPIEIPKDISAADKAAASMTSPYYKCRHKHTVEELIGMLGSMEVVVGMRLHSLIFATAGGAPVIGISYDVKVDSFIKDIGSTACMPLASLSTEWLCNEIDLAMQRGPEKAQEAAERLKEAQKINIDAARRLLARPSERRA